MHNWGDDGYCDNNGNRQLYFCAGYRLPHRHRKGRGVHGGKSDATAPTYGDEVTFTATVVKNNPNDPDQVTGTVQFYRHAIGDSYKLYGPQVVTTGGTKLTLDFSTLQAGEHTIYAVYSGNEYFAGATAECQITVKEKPLAWDVGDLTASRPQDEAGEATAYGALQITGVLEGDTVRLAPETGLVTSGLAGITQPGKYQVEVVPAGGGSFSIDNANYALPKENPTITAAINPLDTEGGIVEQPEGDDGTQFQLEIETGISTVPEELKDNPELDTPKKIEIRLKTEIAQVAADIPEGNVAVYDVKLMASTDGGVTWTGPPRITSRRLASPSPCLIPTAPIKQATSSPWCICSPPALTAGPPATPRPPPVTNTAKGIQFTVHGLSPIAVGWEAVAVSDNTGSSPDSSGSSYRDGEYDFWDTVQRKIGSAGPGDTVQVNARSYDRMPWSVMEALGQAEDVTLRITWNGGGDISIPSAAALSRDAGRIYYPLSYLEGLDFAALTEQTGAGQTGGSTVEVEAPVSAAPDWAPTAPEQGQTGEQPESEESASQPESEPASEPETEPETEPEIQPEEETMARPEKGGLSMGWILGGAVIVAAAGLGFWLRKRRTQE